MSEEIKVLIRRMNLVAVRLDSIVPEGDGFVREIRWLVDELLVIAGRTMYSVVVEDMKEGRLW
jgi:hypothetical protein